MRITSCSATTTKYILQSVMKDSKKEISGDMRGHLTESLATESNHEGGSCIGEVGDEHCSLKGKGKKRVSDL